jgi:hypothetical protein
MPRTRLVAFLIIALLAACSSDDVVRRLTPADADRRARDYIALLARNQVDSAVDRLHPLLAGPDTRNELAQIGTLLGHERFDSSRTIGVHINTISGVRHVNLTYEFHVRSGWVLANVATVDSNNTWFVEGFSAQPLARTLEEEHRFSLAGKSGRHFVWLAVTLMSAVLSLGTAVFLATRRDMPKRWRWVLASLVGIGAFSLNWSTGAVAVSLFNLQLGAAAILRNSPAAPWIMSFAIPLGAIVGILRYRRWRQGIEPMTITETTSPQVAV